ncbi:TIR domain-containing protein [Granulicoccus sp. GXG6511]|uniref:toll/interleukin-1 receptor domain-containing protein n=1 Tax=Granulicoccus sp. GXG6511 TaxID=3381351 RepID=UPI003D7E5DDF
MKIFLSYGHDDKPALVARLTNDLAEDHTVWVDDQIPLGATWVTQIDQALDRADVVIFLLGKNSVRPDSYCFGELAYARQVGKPILVVSVGEAAAPSIIAHEQRLSMVHCATETGEVIEQTYQPAVAELRRQLALREPRPAPSHGPGLPLYSFRNSARVRTLLRGSAATDHLFPIVEEWLRGWAPHLAILGNAGSGKSTAAAAIYDHYADRAAIHFCNYANEKSTDTRLILQSLANQIAQANAAYRSFVLGSVDFERGLDMLAPDDLFDALFLAPFDELELADPYLLIVDGLDECPAAARGSLNQIMLHRFTEIAESCRLVVTSRKDSETVPNLYASGAEVVDQFESVNDPAMRSYVETFLAHNAITSDAESLANIIEQSQGDFMYTKFILAELKMRRTDDVTKVAFPIGMKGVCQSYFDRIFGGDSEYYEKVATPFLEIISVVGTPLSQKVLCEMLGLETLALSKIVRRLDIFLDVRENAITLGHKSIYDWLRSIELTDRYYISLARGLERVCDYVAHDLLTPDRVSDFTAEYGLRRLAEAKRYETIAQLMIRSDPEVRPLLARFFLQMLSTNDKESLVPLFASYAAAGGPANIVLAEAIKTLFQYEERDVAEAIAGCFSSGPDRTAVGQLVAFYAARARNDDTEAIVTAGRAAMELVPDEAVRLDLMRSLADAYREKGDHRAATELYTEASEKAAPLGLTLTVRDCRAALIDLEYVVGHLRSARRSLDLLKAELDFGVPNIHSYKYYRLLGSIFHITGSENRQARAAFQECLDIADQLSFPLKMIETFNSLAEVQTTVESGLDFVQRARDLAARSDLNRLELGKGYYIEANLLRRAGANEAAEMSARTALTILEAVPYASGCARAHLALGAIHAERGEHAAAIEWFRKANAYYVREQIYPSFRAEAYSGLLRSAAAEGTLATHVGQDDLDQLDAGEFQQLGRIRDEIREFIDGHL